jgi:hypothetical protein
MALIRGVVGGIGQVVQGAEQQNAANQQAVDLQKQALEVEKRGEIRKKRLKREGARFLGDQTAAIAASGVEVSGSPLAGLVESQASIREELGDLDRNIKQEATALRTGAFRFREQGRRAMQGAAIGATTGFISSLGQTAQAGGAL